MAEIIVLYIIVTTFLKHVPVTIIETYNYSTKFMRIISLCNVHDNIITLCKIIMEQAQNLSMVFIHKVEIVILTHATHSKQAIMAKHCTHRIDRHNIGTKSSNSTS